MITLLSFGQVLPYTTSCQIRNGVAYGYVHNHKNSFEIDGDVWFYFYDSNGNFLDSEDEYEYEYVSYDETEEIEHTNAPNGTCSCFFDINTAVEANKLSLKVTSNLTHDSELNYTTSCEIRNGIAYGYVNNHKNSFEIDGNVWFYFYNSNGNFLDSEDEYEYEYVSYDETEEIEHTNAPYGACRCYFEIKDAISE